MEYLPGISKRKDSKIAVVARTQEETLLRGEGGVQAQEVATGP